MTNSSPAADGRPAPRLLLASASPARRTLLESAGVDASVLVSGVDEDAALADAQARYGELALEDAALVLARAKAEEVAGLEEAAGFVVVGADSILELDGDMHGKPADAAEARARWQRMRGRSGVLHTGHWVVDTREPEDGGTGGTLGATASTTVHFGDLSDEEIDAYIATGEPLRVAGAFTLDGLGGPYVRGIEGDPSNVVGLSLPLLRELLEEIDIAWHDVRRPAAP
ncbi:Maf family protein [Actinomycetota bacterium]